MLSYLRIKNLALIESVEIEFSDGFNVLTGETGAGKSILLGAINLLLGGRASSDDIRTGETTAVIEGVFDVKKESFVIKKLKEYEIECSDDQLFIKREISSQGRNRILVNNAMCPLSTLIKIGDLLIDIHGQHDHQSLLKPDSHMDVIDSFGEVDPLRAKYEESFFEWEKLTHKHAELLKKEKELKERLDFFLFRVEEIEKADVHAGEDKDLENELLILESSQKLMELSSGILNLLSNSENSAAGTLGESVKLAANLALIDQKTKEAADLINNAKIEIDEALRFFDKYSRNIEHNPARIEEINERLNLISRLKKKYGGTIEEIQNTLKESKKNLLSIENFDKDINDLQEKINSAFLGLSKTALELSDARKKVIKKFDAEITKNLKTLSMQNVVFKVNSFFIESENGISVNGKKAAFDSRGIDKAEMLISPNPGEPLKTLVKIASGGELSRVMLAIKSLLASSDNIPTLIFDEIDSGIGGITANKIGEALEKLGKSHQILCVTHLAPIASFAKTHFVVDKNVEKGRTYTVISKVDSNNRVKEIARMLGDEKSASSLAHAKSLIGGN